MPIVVGIRFKDSGKTYHFDPLQVPLDLGDWAIVETVRGPELGRVATLANEISQDQVIGELKPVLRRATDEDLQSLLHLQQYEPEALQICGDKIAEHQLPMELIKAEYNFDGSRLTFFFTADKRVDFRALVRDLARTFRTRIELRQVGPRDEAKLLGGIGPCGRLLCCSTFLPDFARVSIKMAKDQDLPLNPSKISGVCGRLLCCLSYEHEQYLEIKAELPQRGDWVQTSEGPGEVIAVNVVKENVTVQLGDGNTIDCTAKQISDVRKRVAAEAQARNAEGITPVASSRRGPHPIVAGEEGLFDDDPDAWKVLEDLEDPEMFQAKPAPKRENNPPAPRRDNGSKPAPVRPDMALGDSIQDRRRNQQRQQPPALNREPDRSGANGATKWTPQAHPEPQKELSIGKRHRKHGPPQRPEPTAPSAETAAPEQPAESAGQPQSASSARRRKRHRGRGNKS
ncbi:MAG TPA: regulatory iron-sulfur-containing complex subunit RicT [Herpetosiphonaceae bacterium]